MATTVATLPTNLWKLTIKPGKRDPNANPFRFCRERGIVGVGWRLDGTPRSKKEAKALYREKHSRMASAFNILLNRMEVGDHVWVYGDRSYYLCRVESDWRYHAGGVWDANDIHQVRNAVWKPIPMPLVPGIVKRRLTMPGTSQKIKCEEETRRYSHLLAEHDLDVPALRDRLDVDQLRAALEGMTTRRIFTVLDPDEMEDVAGLYLQSNGWRMIKSSTYRNKRTFECEFQRVRDGVPETAYMQVKSGKSHRLDPADYRPHA